MHQKKSVELLATVRASYSLQQQDQVIGKEDIEKRTFNNNTVIYEVVGSAVMSGVLMLQQTTLELDEESYFPRAYRSDRTVVQAADTTHIIFTVDMFSNVAVVGSNMRGRVDSRRVVVPTGTPIMDIGTVYGWYEVLFWVDLASRQRQRIQWLDPGRGLVENGEVYFVGEQSMEVLGKQIPVTVFKAERERIGEAVLYVDASRRIVRCEQNVTVFELTEWYEQ
jgi:hypothetical protein